MCHVTGKARRYRHLLVSDLGGAVPEYALVVCAVLTVLLAVGLSLGPHVGGMSARLTGEALGAAKGESVDDYRGRGEGSAARDTESPGRRVGRDAAVVVVLLVLLVAVLACAGWVLKEQKRKPIPEAVEPPPARKKQPVENVVQTRLARKRDSLWRLLVENQELLLKNRIEVRHVMTRDLVVVSRSTSPAELARVFRSHEVSYLLVCEGDRRLVGMVNADDHRAKPDATVAELMKPAPAEISPNMVLGAAIARFIDDGISVLPVVEDGRLCGVLTPTDLVLAMQCSLQVWARTTQTMRESSKSAERLEQITGEMRKDIARQEVIIKQIYGEVRAAIRSGKVEPLIGGINKLVEIVERLNGQLSQARDEIRRQKEEIAGLRDPESDEATGVGTRRELDIVLKRLLAMCAPPEQPLSMVMVAADGYTKLQAAGRSDEANDYLRMTAAWLVGNVEPTGFIARYSDDKFAIALPQVRADDACAWTRRLAQYEGWKMADGGAVQPRVGIVSARRGEQDGELLARLEAILSPAPELCEV